jgi:ACS family hexuronate transporter-like MFS transporter
MGFLWVIPWLSFYPSANKIKVGSNKFSAVRPTPMASLTTDVRMWGVVLARFFGDSIWFFYIFWLPDYLSRVRGFSMNIIGLTAWIPFLAAGLGNFAGGSLSGVLIRNGIPVVGARLRVMLVSAAAMALGAGVWFCGNPASAIGLISFVVFAYSCWAANVLTLPSDLFGADAVATTVGFSGTAAGVGGMLTTLLLGRMIDHYSYEPVFLVLGLLPLCAGLCALLTIASPLTNIREASGV